MRPWDNPESFLDELPKCWKYDRLKDVIALREFRTDEKSEVEDYLELEDIESGTGLILSRRNTLEVESDLTCFKKGDVLFGKLRPYLEKYHFADFDGKCTGEILAFAPERIEGHFLRYCVAAPWFIEKCNALAYGAKMPRVNWPKQLAIFDLPLPPRTEQRSIAAYLDKACVAIDGAIRAKRRQLDVLDDLRKSIIHKAVTRGLDDRDELKDSGVEWIEQCPHHWKVKRIKQVTEILRGKFTHRPRNDPSLYDGPYPFIQTGDVAAVDKHIREYKQTLNDEGFSISKQFPRGTLVMTIAANIGDVAILDFEACFPDSIVGFYPHHGIEVDFLYYLFSGLKEVFMSAAVLSTQLNLNIVRIETIRMPIPPVQEQNIIAAFLDEKCEEILRLQRNIKSQVATLEQYRKSLIHECVTGKRRVTETDLAVVRR